MHKLLKKQIERFLGSLEDVPQKYRDFIEVIDQSYAQTDLECKQLELSMELAAKELMERNEQLQKDFEDRKQAEEALRSYAKRLETLHQIDRALLKADSPSDIACEAIERLRDLLNCKRASVTQLDFETGEVVTLCVSFNYGQDEQKGNRYPMSKEFMEGKLREGKVLVSDDLQKVKKPTPIESLLIDAGIRSNMIVPMVARDHLIGTLNLGSETPSVFKEEEIQIAKEVADQLAVAVQQAALLEEVQHLNETLEQRISQRTRQFELRTKEITLLNQMGELMQSCVDSNEAYTVISQHIPRIFPNMDGALGILDEDENRVEFSAAWGLDSQERKLYTLDDCWALRRRYPHLVEQIRPGLLCNHVGLVEKSQPFFTYCVPLISHSRMIGVLHLRSKLDEQQDSGVSEKESYAGRNGFSKEQQNLVLTVAEQIALALANLYLQESLRIMAIRDPLTDLYNRRYMEESMSRELQRSARNGKSLGVIMLDIDKFKDFNDKYGHAVGDALLRDLGILLKDKVRQEDIACRYGGEEFVLILPNSSLDITQERAEQIRKDAHAMNTEVEGQLFENITISLGVSVFPTHGSSWEEVVRSADLALLQAKSEGRDQVVVGEKYKAPKRNKK
ncbi:MAG: diguanylate cyclase [Chloroflexi bacterium]|nr:diguanylate cyclase [Chloroflexota bacterium]